MKSFYEEMKWKYTETIWKDLKDEDFLNQLKEICINNNYKDLPSIFYSIHKNWREELKRRKLLDNFCEKMNWKYRQINWNLISNKEFLKNLKTLCEENNWNKRSDISKDYCVQLQRRKLTEDFYKIMNWNNKVNHNTIWSTLTNDELLEKLKEIASENNCGRLNELYKVCQTGSKILKKRNISGNFCKMMGWNYSPQGKWSNLTDEELLEKIKKIANENNFKKIADLKNVDITSYQQLSKRKLLKEFLKMMEW